MPRRFRHPGGPDAAQYCARAREDAGAPAVGMATRTRDSAGAGPSESSRRRIGSAATPAGRRARARLGDACRRMGDVPPPQATRRGDARKLIPSELPTHRVAEKLILAEPRRLAEIARPSRPRRVDLPPSPSFSPSRRTAESAPIRRAVDAAEPIVRAEPPSRRADRSSRAAEPPRSLILAESKRRRAALAGRVAGSPRRFRLGRRRLADMRLDVHIHT